MRFPMSDDAQAELARWAPEARTSFEALIEDAASDLQREILARAVAAGRTPAEVHAFAAQIRGRSDPEVFDACTIAEDQAIHFTLEQRLASANDPLVALELNGGAVEPRAIEHPVGAREGAAASSSGPLAGAPSGVDPVSPIASTGASVERLLGEATQRLGLAWKEKDLDTRGGVALTDALAVAATALARGIPVPCLMGPGVGQHRRFVLLLQITHAETSRAWQLYEPISRELVWINESDLLMARELPFDDKVNRRLTRIILPHALKLTS